MTAFRKQLCAVVILVLISVALSKRHSRRKRSLVKDYFNPLTYPTTLLKFEKGEDGKYHPSSNSTVEYVLAEAMDSKNEVIEESTKNTDSEASDLGAVVKKYNLSLIENPEAELLTEDAVLPKLPALEKSDTEPIIPVNEDEFSVVAQKEDSKIDSEVKFEAEKKIHSENMDENTRNKIDLTEHKFTLMPKPDSKDEKPYEGQFISDEYGPQPPVDGTEKEVEGKLGIGQFPILLPPFLPHGIQMLLRPRHFPVGQAPMMPVPPAVHISDRLPIIDADVIEEGSETAIIEDVDTGDTFVKGMRRVSANRYNPMSLGIPFPMIPFHQILKEITGEGKLGSDTKSEILEVMGKKILVRKKVLQFPGDNSKLHFRVMSVQPLEDIDPEVLKELDMEEAVSGEKAHEEKEVKEEEESLEKSIINEKEANVGISVAKEGVEDVPLDETVSVHKETEAKETEYSLEKSLISKKDAEVEKDLLEEVKPLGKEKLFPQSDILKVEETQVNEQVFIGAEGKLKEAQMEGESKDLDLSKTVADGMKPDFHNEAEDEMTKTIPENVEKDIDSAIEKHESDEKITKTLQTDELLESRGVDKDQIEADEEKRELIDPKEQVFEDVVEPSGKKLETRNMLAADAKSTEEKIEETATQMKNEIDEEETAEQSHASGDANKQDETDEEEIHKTDEKKHSKDSDELEKKNIKVEDIDSMKSEHVLYEKRKKIISDEKDKKEVLNKKGKKENKCKCEKDKDSDSESEEEEN